jgi:hypothetical protein
MEENSVTSILGSSFTGFRDPSVPVTPEQLAMRKRVYQQVKQHPETFYMGCWEDIAREIRGVQCNTTRCIGGWAQFFARGHVYQTADPYRAIPVVEEDAVVLMGLSEEEYGAAVLDDDDGLFYLDDAEAVERLRILADEPEDSEEEP